MIRVIRRALILFIINSIKVRSTYRFFILSSYLSLMIFWLIS